MSDTEDNETKSELSPRASALAAERETADNLSGAEIVANRSADTSKKASDEHIKVFVLPPGPKPTKGNGFSHDANMAAVRQYMLSQGLRPTGDVRHVSTEPHLGNEARGWALTYAVPATPAERFDFAEVHVITENEDPDGDGKVTGEAKTGAPDESNDDAAKKAAKPKTAGKTKAAPKPTA